MMFIPNINLYNFLYLYNLFIFQTLSPAGVLTQTGVDAAKDCYGENLDLPLDRGAPSGFLTCQDVADVVVATISFRPNVEVN